MPPTATEATSGSQRHKADGTLVVFSVGSLAMPAPLKFIPLH